MAARFCSRCGREVASTAQFCPGCGASLADGAAGVAPATNPSRRLVIPGLVAALVVLGIIVVALASKRGHPVTSAPSAPLVAPPVTSAPAAPQAAPPLTNAPTQPVAAAPVTSAPSKPAPALPPDVAAYLRFLQGIEQRRVALANDTSGADAMMQTARQMQASQGDPEQHNQSVPGNVSQINRGYSDYTAKWNTLIGDFRRYPAPAACAGLANAYYTYVNDYASTISKLQVALMNGDISAAMGAQGAQKQINGDALAADAQIGQLCDHYGVPKPFGIQPEGSSSPLTGI